MNPPVMHVRLRAEYGERLVLQDVEFDLFARTMIECTNRERANRRRTTFQRQQHPDSTHLHRFDTYLAGIDVQSARRNTKNSSAPTLVICTHKPICPK